MSDSVQIFLQLLLGVVIGALIVNFFGRFIFDFVDWIGDIGDTFQNWLEEIFRRKP